MPNAPENEPPPLLGTWKRLYLAVALYLVVMIALLSLLTRTYNQ
jgi:hypothetical protein